MYTHTLNTYTQHDTFVAYCVTFFNGSSYHNYYELYMYVYGMYIMSGSGSGSRRRGSSQQIGESSGERLARPVVYLQPKADQA